MFTAALMLLLELIEGSLKQDIICSFTHTPLGGESELSGEEPQWGRGGGLSLLGSEFDAQASQPHGSVAPRVLSA